MLERAEAELSNAVSTTIPKLAVSGCLARVSYNLQDLVLGSLKQILQTAENILGVILLDLSKTPRSHSWQPYFCGHQNRALHFLLTLLLYYSITQLLYYSITLSLNTAAAVGASSGGAVGALRNEGCAAVNAAVGAAVGAPRESKQVSRYRAA